MKCTFIVFRYHPGVDQSPRYDEFEVAAEPTDKILDCLNRIRWEQDPTLTYRFSCAHGICGSDAVMINGSIGLACQKLVRDFRTGGNFVIEPLPLFRVIRDLVVDLTPFFEKYEQVKPYLINHTDPPEAERRQDPENQEFIESALRCILCASCTASCPINRANEDYLGPAALLRAFRYIFDSRDTAAEDRLRELDTPAGAWGCRNMWWCTKVCPKNIPVTKCLGQIKKRIHKQSGNQEPEA